MSKECLNADQGNPPQFHVSVFSRPHIDPPHLAPNTAALSHLFFRYIITKTMASHLLYYRQTDTFSGKCRMSVRAEINGA